MNSKGTSRELWHKVMESVPDETVSLGPYFSHQLLNNPRHLLFTFSRYKFAAGMLGKSKDKSVLELGCNEGLGSLFLAEVSRAVHAVDFDERAIAWAGANLERDNLRFQHADFLGKTFGAFDAVVMLDVIEHIDREKEDLLCGTLHENLNEHGFCVIGTPNIQASRYASKASQIGHVNLFDEARLRSLLEKYFTNILMFSCNDEMIHTGYYPFAHYLIAVAVK